MIKFDEWFDYTAMSEREALESISKSPAMALLFEDQYPSVLDAAVVLQPRLIKDIKKPTQRQIMNAMNRDPSVYSLIKNPTKDISLKAVNLDGDNFSQIPKIHMCQEFVDIIVEKHPNKFYVLPEKIKTKEMCIKVTQKYPLSLKWVPKNFITNDMLLAAFKVPNNNISVNLIGEGTMEIWYYAVVNDKGNYSSLPSMYRKNTYKETMEYLDKEVFRFKVENL